MYIAAAAALWSERCAIVAELQYDPDSGFQPPDPATLPALLQRLQQERAAAAARPTAVADDGGAAAGFVATLAEVDGDRAPT